MSKSGYSEQIRTRINSLPKGKPFTASDFSDIATVPTVRRVLQRLSDAGAINRVMDGIYVVPEHSELLDEEVPPAPADIAQAIARKHGWTIAPTGNTALNRLGISTQIPAVWTYVSDGPYASYEYGNTRIKFSHSANRNITGMSPVTSLVFQAIKALGKEGKATDVLSDVFSRMTEAERSSLLDETRRCTGWIRKEIIDMARGAAS